MIIELAGLPGTGKTTRAQELAEEYRLPVVVAPTNALSLFTKSLLGAAFRPRAALALLRLLLKEKNPRIRRSLFINGLLGSSAKYWSARRGGIIDQGYIQATIATLPTFGDSRIIARVLTGVPAHARILWSEADASVRTERLRKRGRQPRAEFGEEEVQRFAQKSEEAYALVRRVAEQVLLPQKHSAFRNTIKLFSYVVAYGISRIVHFFYKKREVAVLMYHSVDYSGWKLSVTPEVFEKQVQYLVKHKQVVPISDIVAYVKREKDFSKNTVAITFDDGYQDLLTQVLPIIEKYQVPITVFVPSDFSAHTDPAGTERLSVESLRILLSSPLVTLGSHACTHRKLTELSSEEVSQEVKQSAIDLEKCVTMRPRYFAYPFGARSSSVERAVSTAGYDAAFGITEGLVQPGASLFSLPRVQADQTMNTALFRLRLTAAVDWNRIIVRAFRAIIPV